MGMTRRGFLGGAIATGAAVGFPSIVPATALGKDGKAAPSDRVNIGLIACGNRSGAANAYIKHAKAQIVAVCDPIRERRLKKKAKCGNCADYNDFRDLLARDDVDAVHVSTADHWHVPISLAAARAGKDMYTEKPLGISIEQCLAARQIGRKHERIFQYGTQNRSMAQLRLGLQLALNGHIGEIKEVHVWCPPGASGGSASPILSVPEGYDYDMWLGPAPKTPFCKDRSVNQGPRNGIFHIYDYAIGFIAGWGAHPMDQTQWWADTLGLGIPVRYEGAGKIPTEGLFNTLTHWDMKCTYANGLVMRFMDRDTAREKNATIKQTGFGHGTLLVGDKGWVAVTRGGWKVHPEPLYKEAKDPGKVLLQVSGSHTDDFVDAVLGRTQPVSNLESAVRSDIICHLCDITVRTGRPITWDPKKETIVGDPEAAKRISRPMRKPWTL